MLRWFAVGAIAVATPLSAASAEKVASAEHITTALIACLEATSVSGVDEVKLGAAGFASGTIEANGKTIETPLRIFGRANNPAMVITMQDPRPACSVTSRIASFKGYPAIAEAISRALQSKPIKQEGNEFFWRRSSTLIVHLAATGSQQKPSIRIGVVAMQGEKK